MIRYVKFLGGLLLASTLAACGGGGGSPGTTQGGGGSTGGGGTTTTPPAASLDVFTSSPELSSASNSSITFTVVAKDANNQAVPGQTVTFSATSGSLSGSLPPPHTGANGEAITGVSLQTGADRSNRDITVTLVAGGVTKTVVIPVTGTKLSIAGDSFVLMGASTNLTVKAVDSSGTAIPNATLTVSSSLGNAITPTSVVTNSQGVATFAYTGTRAGNDTLTVSGLGTNATASVAVNADNFSFETPATNTSVTVGAAQTVTVRYLSGGVPVVGQQVTFSTTRGTITPTTGVTDAQGRASASVTSTSAGPANVVAQTSAAQVTLPVTFVAVTPSTLVLQANPGAVPPNAAGATSNQATLSATVRDASGNPVAGKVVNFSAVSDGSSGTISPGSAVTDLGGIASTQFIPGPGTTANNGVVLRATVQGTTVAGTTALTVNTAALFISIATGNQISNLSQTTYQKEFSVYVTDANGAPASGRIVNLSVLPTVYRKGFLQFDGEEGFWFMAQSTTCQNEDLDRDGVLDAGEDFNGNGRLEPGLPVVVAPASVTTDTNGFAVFNVQYGENFVPWLDVNITARTSVGGTESVKNMPYRLVGLDSDFNNQGVPPAGERSPFGVQTSCANPN